MLINLAPQHIQQVANQLNNPVSFVILLFDKTNIFTYHRERLISVQKIARNWRVYQKRKIRLDLWHHIYNKQGSIINYLPCPFNADFDGDEMNIFIPHTSSQVIELNSIKAQGKHIKGKHMVDSRKEKILNRLRKKLGKS